jgi:uncharacterized damage-inducible protein DinB
MILKELIPLFERDLLKLKEEIGLYGNEGSIWSIQENISNSGGNLCLHLCGNLDHFIGAVLGNTGFVRDRDSEFTRKGITAGELQSGIDSTIVTVNRTLHALNEEDLNKEFPLQKHGQTVTTAHMLLHLLTHLNYHLGQVNYHRRMIIKG